MYLIKAFLDIYKNVHVLYLGGKKGTKTLKNHKNPKQKCKQNKKNPTKVIKQTKPNKNQNKTRLNPPNKFNSL